MILLVMSKQHLGLHDNCIRYRKRNHKNTLSYACIYCTDPQVGSSDIEYALVAHKDELSNNGDDAEQFHGSQVKYEAMSIQQR